MTAAITPPIFPRGFIFATRSVSVPESFQPGPLVPGLYVHPWLTVAAAGDTDQFVIILGICVPTGGADEDSAQALLGQLRAGEDRFLQALDHYAGRYAIVYGSTAQPRVVQDATAMRSVFYAPGIVASHALLVERALGGDIRRDDLPHRYGYPGNRTPYGRTRLLIANTLYDIAANEVHRFWPRQALPERSVEGAAAVCLAAASRALRHVAVDRPIKLALTAGLDSRTMLAVALHSGVEVEAYTYGRGPDTLLDRGFAADLADRHGIRHEVVPSVPMRQDLASRLAEAHYSGHHRNAVASLRAWISDPNAVAVTANLLEIGRSFYKGRRDAGMEPPRTAAAMSALHYHGMGRATKEAITEYGHDRYMEVATDAFQDFIDTTRLGEVEGLLDPFDQFYWEHRMSAWHGTAMVERDFYAEAFIPFNSRAIFEAMLSVPHVERDAGSVQRALIELVDSSLLDLPINPTAWPPVVTART